MGLKSYSGGVVVEMYCDNFCRIQDMGNGKAWYSTRYMDAFCMPKKWAEKIVRLFEEGYIYKAYYYIDMVERKNNGKRI